jgi:hypothetical protein
MKRIHPAAALFCVAIAPCAASAQSLGDAVNAALVNECSALGGATARYTDTWQYDGPTNTIAFTSTDPSRTAATLTPTIVVPDGVGRNFPVRASTVSLLDPAVANALTEPQLAALFEQTGVQRLVIRRFADGAFSTALSGLCNAIVEARTNLNGNTAGSGGFAGGASTASGRSVGSLSSAREQSSEEKKRKKKKKERQRTGDAPLIRLASADGGLGLASDASGALPFGVEASLDLRGGYVDLDRKATALEGAFDGRALWGRAAASVDLAPSLALVGSAAINRARGTYEGVSASGDANRFHDRSVTGAFYAIWSAPVGGATLDLSAGAFFGGGSGDVERTASITRQARYLVDVTDPVMVVDTLALDRTTLIADDLFGAFKTRQHGVSVAASLAFDLGGGRTIAPGVEHTRYNFRQKAYDERATDAFDNGFALSFSEFRDKWSETRLGGVLAQELSSGVRFEAYGDLVLVGGAETPQREALFAGDLRATPYLLSYRVDDLDKAYGRIGAAAAAPIGEAMEAFVGVETTLSHDYLRQRAVYAGLRFRL